MLKMLTGAVSALMLSLAPVPASAQDADPALWVVKDADTTVYLFGTMHAMKPGLTWFDEAVKTAFDASGELVFETVEPPPAELRALVMRIAVSADGTPLTEKLPRGAPRGPGAHAGWLRHAGKRARPVRSVVRRGDARRAAAAQARL